MPARWPARPPACTPARLHACVHTRMYGPPRWMYTYAASAQYGLRTSGKCAIPITSQSECNAAAMYLKGNENGKGYILSTSSNVETNSTYPPGCHYDSDDGLYFNKAANSSIGCSHNDQCICKFGTSTLLSKLASGRAIALRSAADATLTNNIIIKQGSIVVIDGAGRTLRTGYQQFKVNRGARLCMYNFNLIDGKVCVFFKRLDVNS